MGERAQGAAVSAWGSARCSGLPKVGDATAPCSVRLWQARTTGAGGSKDVQRSTVSRDRSRRTTTDGSMDAPPDRAVRLHWDPVVALSAADAPRVEARSQAPRRDTREAIRATWDAIRASTWTAHGWKGVRAARRASRGTGFHRARATARTRPRIRRSTGLLRPLTNYALRRPRDTNDSLEIPQAIRGRRSP